VIAVKDEAELHMLANMYVVEPRLFYIQRFGLSLRICRASLGGSIRSYRVFERIETLYLRLNHFITAGRSTRAFTCMHVASRIAGNPNPARRRPTVATLALKNRSILDESGSAFVAR